MSCLLAGLALLIFPSVMVAQVTAPFAPSNRLILRGFLLPERGLKVQVLENRGDTLVVQPDQWPERLVVPTRHIHRIQLSRGRQPNTGTGMLLGCITGLVVGFGLSGSHFLASSMYGALAGSGLGAMAGAAIRTEKWGPVAPP
jgi:hypothetical protein